LNEIELKALEAQGFNSASSLSKELNSMFQDDPFQFTEEEPDQAKKLKTVSREFKDFITEVVSVRKTILPTDEKQLAKL